jgi:hypothetical protein
MNDVHVHFNYSVTSYHSIHTQSIRISQHITTQLLLLLYIALAIAQVKSVT